MSLSDWCRELNPTYILIGIMIVIIIILLIMNYPKSNQIYAQYSNESFASSNSEAHKLKLVLYYTNWCGYSKMLLPHWNKLKEKLNGNPSVEVEEIDCEKNKDSCRHVPGYPTVLLFDDKKAIAHFSQRKNGETYPRTYEGLLLFLGDNGIKY